MNENLLFEEYTMPVAKMSEFPRLDRPLSYVHDFSSFRDMSATPKARARPTTSFEEMSQ
ncbi:hypothetical protein [Breoghania sp.]|uniref:hypothetical protein n=1 Tax=Breoghania sp. TaxID=2065378 RepID=UPI002622293A|nr:hypothetical protein [Breoghania sp.]MDJ0932097.1 hypothetical protein [Breoghania sp.]